MDNKPAQNIQDSFLNTARKDRLNITIYLVSGVKLTGRIRSFDKYSVVLETNNQEQLIFKHAISTIAMGRVSHGHIDRPARDSCELLCSGRNALKAHVRVEPCERAPVVAVQDADKSFHGGAYNCAVTGYPDAISLKRTDSSGGAGESLTYVSSFW